MAEFCPRCSAPRTGVLRYCRSCQFDFEPSRDAPGVAETAAAGPEQPTPAATSGSALWAKPAKPGSAGAPDSAAGAPPPEPRQRAGARPPSPPRGPAAANTTAMRAAAVVLAVVAVAQVYVAAIAEGAVRQAANLAEYPFLPAPSWTSQMLVPAPALVAASLAVGGAVLAVVARLLRRPDKGAAWREVAVAAAAQVGLTVYLVWLTCSDAPVAYTIAAVVVPSLCWGILIEATGTHPAPLWAAVIVVAGAALYATGHTPGGADGSPSAAPSAAQSGAPMPSGMAALVVDYFAEQFGDVGWYSDFVAASWDGHTVTVKTSLDPNYAPGWRALAEDRAHAMCNALVIMTPEPPAVRVVDKDGEVLVHRDEIGGLCE